MLSHKDISTKFSILKWNSLLTTATYSLLTTATYPVDDLCLSEFSDIRHNIMLIWMSLESSQNLVVQIYWQVFIRVKSYGKKKLICQKIFSIMKTPMI